MSTLPQDSPEVDVAIVGAGPTGLALALWLARAGHRVTLIERHESPYPLPRAVAFDDEIARIFNAIGVLEAIECVCERPASYQWRNAKRELLFEMPVAGNGPSGWPLTSIFSQPQLEDVLRRAAGEYPNIEVLNGWEATGLTEGPQSVALTLVSRSDRRQRTVAARYGVGADGANSFVRGAIGGAMVDLGFAADWLVVDVLPRVAGERLPTGEGRFWQLCDPARPTTIVGGGPGRYRWEFMALEGETPETLDSAEMAWRLLAPWGVGADNALLERHAVYRFKGAVADRWRRGRVFIAGDAAHLMPPFAGQGLCAGVRDAAALGWRLNLALRGLAGPGIFESYQSERAFHAGYWIHTAIELGKIICVLSPEAASARDGFLLAARADPAKAPPPPPPPRLGPGLHGDVGPAGMSAIGAEVVLDGRTGLIDRLVAPGFVLLQRGAPPALSRENERFWRDVGGVTADFGEAGQMQDPTGRYQAWFDEIGADAVLVRPDFYVFGTARGAGAAETLIGRLRETMGS